MKKYIIICFVVILAIFCWVFFLRDMGFFISLSGNKEVETFTTVSDQTIMLDRGNGMEPFEIRGVNLGVGLPGKFATEYAIHKETYLRWFELIQDMGANCIRVYTILQDDFYSAVWEYNHNNEDPLYIIHGLWVDDYVLYSHRDAYDEDFLNAMLKDSKRLVDILHGNKFFSLGEDTGSGFYSKDVSPWVLGYILGVEWEDTTVAFTNHMEDTRNSYQGKYMYTTEDASPFEAMLAQVGDKLIEYETLRYQSQRLISFTNWPTTDPLEWPEAIEYYFRKFEQVDAEHIKTSAAYLSGQFASYHIYPYYPDYYGVMDGAGLALDMKEEYTDENGVFNSYLAYLNTINNYHTMPVVVAEYGTPSSRGRAQTDRNTDRSQGGMSEAEQGEALVSCYQDILSAGCAGSIAFTWQDEWFKRTWNTMAYTDLTKTPYWSDYQTNEQYFGLLAFDPGKEESVCYVDGDVSEWKESDVVSQSDHLTISSKYDEKYIYFYIHKENYQPDLETLYVPIDTTPKTGSTTADGIPATFERASDFVMMISEKKGSKVLVQERYEALRAMYSQSVYKLDAYLNEPEKDTEKFVPIRLLLQIPMNLDHAMEDTDSSSAETYDTGNLLYGNGNPESPDFNSLSDYIIQGDNIEIRLPWSLLNFMNPSEMVIHDDYYEHYGIEGLSIKEMHIGVGTSSSTQDSIAMEPIKLTGWGRKPTYHERLKQGYYDLQELWAGK